MSIVLVDDEGSWDDTPISPRVRCDQRDSTRQLLEICCKTAEIFLKSHTHFRTTFWRSKVFNFAVSRSSSCPNFDTHAY